MSPLVLDTSAYSAYLRGNPSAISAVKRADRLCLPAIVIGELLGGFELGTKRNQNTELLEEFLASPRVSVVPVTQETAARYAIIYAHLRHIGRPVPTNDLWIAATTMQLGGELLTADRHFSFLPQIIVKMV